MSYVSDLSQSNEYLSFRSSIPLRKIVVDSDSSKAWRIFDSGPKSVRCPLICLPSVSGTADVFFMQLMGLASRGVRVIAAEPPPYWNMKEWIDGFKRLIDYLELDRVHIYGASLGGFMAQKFAELTRNCPRVASMVLCNTFTDTSVFEYNDSSALFWLLPSLVLKRMLMGNFTTDKVDKRIAESIDFMVERIEHCTFGPIISFTYKGCLISTHFVINVLISQAIRDGKNKWERSTVFDKDGPGLPIEVTTEDMVKKIENIVLAKRCIKLREIVDALESLNQSELASRLTLNCTPCYIQPHLLNDMPITIMDVWDESALSSRVREDLYKSYPQAKLAHLKSGGNFPYLSRSDEVNLHLLIHLRQFDGTELSSSYLSLVPHAQSGNHSEEGTVSYFNQRDKFVKIS